VPEAVDSLSTTSSNSDLCGEKASPVKDDQLSRTPDSAPKFSHSGVPTPVTTPFTYRSSVSKSFREPSSRGNPSRRPGSSKIEEDETGGKQGPDVAESSSGEQRAAKTIQSSSSKEAKLRGASSKNKDTEDTPAKPQAPSARSPATKSHPYSRKMDITPRKPSPSMERSERTRPRILSYENSKNGSSPFSSAVSSSPKPRNAQIKRRSTISSPANRAKLLPATPVRRKPQESSRHIKSRQLPSRSAGNSCRNSLLIEEPLSEGGSTAEVSPTSSTKLANSSQDLSTCGKEGGGERLDATGLSAHKNTTPVSSVLSADERSGDGPSTPKLKHTFRNSGE